MMPSPPTSPNAKSSNSQQRQGRVAAHQDNNNYKGRSRSHSPVKTSNRQSFPESTGSIDDEDEIRSVISTPSISPSQLKQISRSPLALRMHVVSSSPSPSGKRYNIPVPLTLKLPPRLSPSKPTTNTTATIATTNTVYTASTSTTSNNNNNNNKSPNNTPGRLRSPRKPKQVTLIYTPQGYEKVSSSSSSDNESDFDSFGDSRKTKFSLPSPKSTYLDKKSSSPSLAKKSPTPPSVASNNNKYSKMAFPYRDSDELSTIEEASHAGSRTSTIMRKKTTMEKEKRMEPSPFTPTKPNKKLPPLPFTADEERRLNIANALATPSIPTPNRQNPNPKVERSPPPKAPISQTTSSSRFSDPRSAARRKLFPGESSSHLNKPITNGIYNQDSHASSVSSFSSAGEFSLYSCNRKPMDAVQAGQLKKVAHTPLQETTNIETHAYKSLTRPHIINSNLRVASTDSSSSDGSWRSLQPSIDISLSRETTCTPARLKSKEPLAFTDKNVVKDDEDPWVDVDSSDDNASIGTAPLSISKKTPSLQPQPQPLALAPKPTHNHENTTTNHDNEGAGHAYSFPNSPLNVTNSESFQKEKRDNIDKDNRSSASRHIFYSNGQIEIPDLSKKAVMDQYSFKTHSVCSEAVFSETRTETSVSEFAESVHSQPQPQPPPPVSKMRFPSEGALNHLREQLKLQSLEDDSDFEVTSKSASDSYPKVSNASPLRHRRGKSMHSINFEVDDKRPSGTISSAGHARSKSADVLAQTNRPNRRTHTRGNSFDALKEIEQMKLVHNQDAPGKTPGKTPGETPGETPGRESQKQRRSEAENTGAGMDKLTREKEAHAVAEEMKIVICEPPKAVQYAVDFKETNFKDDDFGALYATPKIPPPPSEKEMSSPLRKTRKSKAPANSKSRSKTKTRTSQEEDNCRSESDSITIDLTDEQGEKCTVKRTNSTTSYKSVTETINGADVEVIILDDDDDEAEAETEADDDELLSIYSKYRNDSWLFGVGNASTISTASSRGSANTCENANQLRSLTTAGRIVHELNLKRSNVTPADIKQKQRPLAHRAATMATAMRRAEEERREYAKRGTAPNSNDNYFDYAMNENYNFDTFMKETRVQKSF